MKQLLHGRVSWKQAVARKLIVNGACFKLGKGYSINPWTDPWVPGVEGSIPKARKEIDISRWRRVANFKACGSNDWNEVLILETFEPDTPLVILTLKWPGTDCDDKLLWKKDKMGRFTVGSSYLQNCTRRTERNLMWEHLWPLKVHERLKLSCGGLQQRLFLTRRTLLDVSKALTYTVVYVDLRVNQ